MPSSVYLNSLQCSRTRAPIAEDFGCASVSAGRREGSAGWLRCISMEFIRHIGELHCSKCERVESDRNIYYAQGWGHSALRVRLWSMRPLDSLGIWIRGDWAAGARDKKA